MSAPGTGAPKRTGAHPFVKYFVHPTLAAASGVLPPLGLYFLLFLGWGIDITGPAYFFVAVGISLTTVGIWVEVLMSLRPEEPQPLPKRGPWPTVSVIIAAYLPNEHETIFDTLEAFTKVKYEGKRQVILAYNTPEDMPEVEGRLHRFARKHRGFQINRVYGSTSKAQNVNDTLPLLRGELVGVFDADHQPAVDSFRRAVRWIVHSGADIVQGRCVVRNGGETLMSKLVAVEFEQIYGVAHPGRAKLHGFGIFGGTNGYWRTSLLQEITFDTNMLTEDVESGIRSLRAGRKIVSDPHLVSYELATTTLPAFWSQRMRWAQGWFQVTLLHTLALVFGRGVPLRQRVGAFHLFAWREFYPWLALQMWAIIGFWVYRYTLYGIDWNVLPWVLLTVVNLGTGPALVLVAWWRAHPEVRGQWQWFLLAMVLAPVYSEIKNGICRVTHYKQLRGGQHEWVVTPRSPVRANRPALA